jgi:phage terminase Nu1 subunit (DNA packaging protein)
MPTIRNSEQGRRLAKLRWERKRATETESEAEARRRLTSAKADKAEIDARARRGELVERAKAEHAIFEFARRMRDAWTHWPARIAATLAARLGADPHAVEAALASEVRRHLEELSRDPLPRLGGPGAG